ncbi:MAG: hypothetical protein ABSH34_17510 [Verrucomicrobiota bacterium]
MPASLRTGLKTDMSKAASGTQVNFGGIAQIQRAVEEAAARSQEHAVGREFKSVLVKDRRGRHARDS